MRTIKSLIALVALLAALLVCGYLLYYFHTINYLPFWINMAMRLLCVVAIGSAIALFVAYMKVLDAESRSERRAAKAKAKQEASGDKKAK